MITLNGTWQMNCKGEDSWQEGQVPGTVYTELLRNGQMKDPYVGENEDEVRDLSYNDYTYRRTFEVEEKTLQNTKNVLVCEGLDTLADVYLNGTHMGSCENMHRTYRFDVTELLKAGTNEIVVELHSPLKYMEEQYEKRPLWGGVEYRAGISAYPESALYVRLGLGSEAAGSWYLAQYLYRRDSERTHRVGVSAAETFGE